MYIKCESCQEEHLGEYGSGRFCSAKCARGYSTKLKRAEINAKVAEKLKGVPTGRTVTPQQKRVMKEGQQAYYEALPFHEKSEKVRRKIVLGEQDNKCLICGLDEWLGKPLALEVDHINGDRFNNDRANLRALCPNCHSQTPTFRGANNKEVVRTEEDVLDALRTSTSIHQALNKLRLNRSGRTYNNLRRAMEKYGIVY